MQEEKQDYYVYAHVNVETNEIFYVGKGRKLRAISEHGRSKIWKNITSDYNWDVIKLHENLSNDVACELELLEINRRNPVANVHKKDLRKKKMDAVFIFKRYKYSEDSPTGLIYNEDNGQSGRKRRLRGDIAGTKRSNGYFTVSTQGSNVLAHRVVWLLCNGDDPEDHVIDHIDGDRSNNKIENLRKIKPKDNNKNTTLRKDNTTGLCGVHYVKGLNLYCVTWVDPDTEIPKRKTFSVLKYGNELAFELACYSRLHVMKDSDYTERHVGTIEFDILSKMTNEEIQTLLDDSGRRVSNTSGLCNVSTYRVKNNEFWKFSYKSYSISFSVTKYGHGLAKSLAVEARDRYFGNEPKPVLDFSLHETSQMLCDNTRASNSSGFTGISFIKRADGSTYVLAQVMINYKNHTKSFDCLEFGLIQAHAKATEWRLKEREKYGARTSNIAVQSTN